MTDKELLEAAARAAGYTLELHHDVKGTYWPWCIELDDHWCPLTDDGDALRLAVKLNLALGNETTSAVGGTSGAALLPLTLVAEHHNGDPYAATRRAIVRAAAEIGSLHNAEVSGPSTRPPG